MKLSFFLFVNFACGAAADQSLRGGESNTGGITSTNNRSLQIMNNSLLNPGESKCDLHSDLDGTYVCSVRSNGSVNDATYSPETHLACVTSGESQYCANIGLSDSGGMIPGDGGGVGGPGSDDMAPPPNGGDIMPDVEEEAPFDDVSDDMSDEDMPVPGGGAGPGLDDVAPPPFGEDMMPDVGEVASFDDVPDDMPDEDMPVPDDEEEVNPLRPGGGGGASPNSATGLMPNQGGGEKCPGNVPTQGAHCGGWVPTGASEASCYYKNGTEQCNCALQDGDANSVGWDCRSI